MKRKLILTHSKPSQLRIQQTITSTSITTPPHFKKTLVFTPSDKRVSSALAFSTTFTGFPLGPKVTPPSTELEGRRSPVRSSRRCAEGDGGTFFPGAGDAGGAPAAPSASSISISMGAGTRYVWAVDLVYVWEILGLRVQKFRGF